MLNIIAAAALAGTFFCAMKAWEKAREASRWWVELMVSEDSFQKLNALSNQLAFVGGALMWALFALALFTLFLVSGAMSLLT